MFIYVFDLHACLCVYVLNTAIERLLVKRDVAKIAKQFIHSGESDSFASFTEGTPSLKPFKISHHNKLP